MRSPPEPGVAGTRRRHGKPAAGVSSRRPAEASEGAARSASAARHSAARSFIAASAIGVTCGWNATNIGAIPSEFAEAYRVGLATVGLFTTALFITHMATQVPGGKAADRYGARRVSLVGVSVIVAGNLLALTAAALAIGLTARLVTGLGTGAGFIAGSAYVRATGGSPMAQGVFGGIGMAASGLALAIVPIIEPWLGWRAPYLSGLAVALAAIAAIALAPADPSPPQRVRAVSAGLLRDQRLRRIAVLFSFSFGLSVALGNWVVEMLQRHADVSSTTAGLAGSLILLLGMGSRPLGGWILTTAPNRVRLAVALGLGAGAVGTAMLVVAQPLWLSVVGAALIGAGGGIAFAPAFTGAAASRPDAPAGAVGLVNTAAATTILVGTPLLGLTFGLPGEGRVGFAMVAALWIAALALLPSARTLGAGGDS